MDLYQNNGMDKNRIYIKELYLFEIASPVLIAKQIRTVENIMHQRNSYTN